MVKTSIQLTTEAQAILRGLKEMPANLATAVAIAMDKTNEETVGHIKEVRLTGKGPFPSSEGKLGVRTNRLRASLRPSKAVITNGIVQSAIGTNVVYAGVHEFGFQGEEQVAAHTRQHFSKQVIFGKRKKVRGADINVRTFTRKMNIPARAPISRGIEECLPNYSQSISDAVADWWNSQK
jgi:phage gpG-like protein